MGTVPERPTATTPPVWRRHGLWLVTLLSLALNLDGIRWGLPARWHPDEKADLALQMAQAGRVSPDSFINPTLPLAVTAPILALQSKLAALGWLAGQAADPLLAGRLLSALAGALAVLLLGLSTRPSVLPALLLALAPGFVNLCHFATPEPWLLLATAATLFLAVRHADGRAPAWALGLVLGLAVSTKYTAAALLLPVAAAVLLRASPERARPRWTLVAGLAPLAGGLLLASGLDRPFAEWLRAPAARLLLAEHALGFVVNLERSLLLLGLGLVVVSVFALRGDSWARRVTTPELLVVGALAAAAFLAGTPGALVHPQRFLGDLAFNHQTRFEYKGLVGESTSYLAYLGLLGDALTPPLAVAAGFGLLVSMGRLASGMRREWIWLTAAVAPYLLVASSGHRAMRFLAPALPALAAVASAGLGALRPAFVGVVATGVVLARAALGTALVLRLFFVDSRLLAFRWLEQNVPQGAVVDLISNHPGYAPAVPEGRTLRVMRTLSREMAPAEVFAEAAARYPSEAADWLILPAGYYERFLQHPEQRPERAAFFTALLSGRAGFDVVARFQQPGWKHPPAEFLDPEIVILRKRPASSVP